MSSSPEPTYPSSLFNQYTIAFEGSSVACVLYGVYIIIATTNLTLLYKKRYRLLLSFTIVQLVLTTLYLAISLYAAPAQSLAIFSINGLSYGPDALSPWPSIFVDVVFVLNTWVSDAFLLYRNHVVWMGNKYALIFPVALYLATVGSSLAWLVVSSTPGAVYSTHVVQVTGTWYWSFSAALNICASCLISVRLWMHRQAISQVGPHLGQFYLGYMSMTLESALLYTVFVIIALIVFTANSPLENVFFPVLGMVQAIAPSLIINRIACGTSFETDKRGSVMTANLSFAAVPGRARTLRPTRHEMVQGSETAYTRSNDTGKLLSDQRDSHSLIHETREETKEDV